MEASSSDDTSTVDAGGLFRMGSGATFVTDSVDLAPESNKKLPSSKYKGVVPQPNGRWGAQIYHKHHRVWLGTFNHETEAARAYDVAAQRFRSGHAVTNFTPLFDALEISFLTSHSKSEIVDMLRKHTYSDELDQSKRHFRPNSIGPDQVAPGPVHAREQLFEKIVTPSDVGKLNRLVIPKHHAEKHFPVEVAGKGVLLNLEDVNNDKVWRFRYSYWNSSQSYVLTKGWSRFVKDKGLKAGDVISFHRSTGPESQLYIDSRPKPTPVHYVTDPIPINVFPDSGLVLPSPTIRLFGVNILGLGTADVSGKRGRGNDDVLPDLLRPLESSNKKRVLMVGAL